jgi:hypothetical protein
MHGSKHTGRSKTTNIALWNVTPYSRGLYPEDGFRKFLMNV